VAEARSGRLRYAPSTRRRKQDAPQGQDQSDGLQDVADQVGDVGQIPEPSVPLTTPQYRAEAAGDVAAGAVDAASDAASGAIGAVQDTVGDIASAVGDVSQGDVFAGIGFVFSVTIDLAIYTVSLGVDVRV